MSRREQLALLVLLCSALALRLWHLWDIPGPTDEIGDVNRALLIARGELLPLTAYEPYIGALWNYLLAGLFLVFGPNPIVPRLLPLLGGTLTIAATLLLAREMAGPLAGWVAALLMATASAHIITNSHIAWSHTWTPLCLALAGWQLHRGLRCHDGRGLLWCGLWLGVALQLHPTMLAVIPGFAAYFLARGHPWLKTRWPYLAALLVFLTVLNLIFYNLQSGPASIERAQAVSGSYLSRQRSSGTQLYAGNLARLGLGGVRVISGAIDIRSQALDFLRDPLVIAPVVLTLAGALALGRRRDWLLPLVLLPYVSLLALFNSKYEIVPNARFLLPMLPVAFAASGALAAMVVDRWPGRRLAVAAVVLAVAILSSASLLGLIRRYDQMAGSVRTTADLAALVEMIERQRSPDEAVLLDRNLDKLWLDGGADLWMTLDFAFRLRNVPLQNLPTRGALLSGDTNPCSRQLVIAARIDQSSGIPSWLQRAMGPNPAALPRRFWTFRVVPQSSRTSSLGVGETLVLEYQPPLSASARTVDRCAPGRLI
jgi:4-amino-4-deoxy-L-arabinose transferase-like glycosyltransferase